jgi:F0F1-type ATP synthase assembly protein I
MIEKKSEYLEDEEEKEEPIEQLPYTPETADETARKSGLAYGAGLVLFGSVLIMLFLGWLGDQFFHTAPWLLVGGIFVGAILGFYLFFRTTSQIIKDR